MIDVALAFTVVVGVLFHTVYKLSFEDTVSEVKYKEPEMTLDLAVRFDSFGVYDVLSQGKKRVITATNGEKFTVNWDDDIENMTSFEVRTMPAGNRVLCAYDKCAVVL